MEFDPNETQALIERTARDFAGKRLAPLAAEIDETEQLPAEILRELATVGLIGFGVPADLGGSDAGPVAFALSMMQIARGCASTAVTMGVTNMVAEIIARFGSSEQREQYCPPLTTGELLAGSFALSEPTSGSDAASLHASATPRDGGFVLQGQKAWVTSAPYAGVFVVWARTRPLETHPGHRGISCFLVDAATPGFVVGPKERKMGLRGSATAAIALDDCWVPERALLGEPERGFAIAMAALDGGRIGVSAQAIGIAEQALDEAVAYARERRQFGRPIGDFQAIQWMVADSRAELDAARLLCLRAAQKKERGQPFSREASMAKLFATEAAFRVCDRAVQIHGGNGYVRDYPAERHLRDVRVTRIYEGTSEIQRAVVARSLLG
jgi:alkylation response protein AidB-like acyl-CoA dehydrogenase